MSSNWQNQYNAQTNAQTLGTMVDVALMQAAMVIDTVRAADAAFKAGDVEQAGVLINNAAMGIGPDSVFRDFRYAWQVAIPTGGEPVSGY